MRKLTGKLIICGAPLCMLLTGCPTDPTGGAPGLMFTIGNKTFGFTMGTTGIFFQKAGDPPQRKAAAIPLFADTPTDRPTSAAIALDSSQVMAIPLSVPNKLQASSQTVTGSADVLIRLGSGSSTDPCGEGVQVGTFDLEFTGGLVVVGNPQLDIPATALDFVISGSFTICLEVTTTVDVELTIDEFDCVFGPSSGVDGNGNDGVDGLECFSDSNCLVGMVCRGGECVDDPNANQNDNDNGNGNANENVNQNANDNGAVDPCGGDCLEGEICVMGVCTSPPDPQPGFTEAGISRIGAEHLIAGQDADPNLSFQSPAGYAPGPFGAKSSVLSGDGNKVWVALFDSGPNVEGDPQMQLWSVNTDGTGALRSSFPMEDMRNGLHLTTNLDGSVVVADNVSTNNFYRASPGTGTSVLYSYDGIADARGAMRISDDGTQFIYVNFSPENVAIADISSGSPTPQVLITTDSLEANGFSGGQPRTELDINSSATRWMMGTRVFDSNANPNLWPIFIGDGLSAPTTSRVTTERDDVSFSRFNMTDDGQTIAYCRASAINGPVARCFIQSVGAAARTEIADVVENVGNLSLSDDGSKAYLSTRVGSGGGQGFIYDVATGERYTGGSQWFSGDLAPDFSDVQWSDDARLFMAAVSGGIYVLHDGSVPAGFPTIDRILYRMNDDACSMTVRVVVNAPIGIERIFTLPFYQGLEASRGVIPGDENPLHRDRTGGGVNKSTTFTLVETGVWEREVFLTNSEGECVSSLLSADFSIRIILVEETTTRTVFADFVPVP